jgi:DNA-binding CsgD family transcriptional regulator
VDADPDLSRADATGAIRISRMIGWAAGETYAHVAHGAALAGGGDYGAALRAVTLAEEMAALIDHQQWLVIARLAHGIMLTHLGALDTAATVFTQARDAAAMMGAVQFVRQAEGCLALCAVTAGRETEAESLLAPLLPTEDRPHSIAERRALLARAALDVRRGRPEEALGCTRRLSLPPRDDDAERWTPVTLLIRAEAFTGLGRVDAAREALEAARQIALTRGPRAFAWQITAALAVLDRRPGQPDKAMIARARTELESLLHSIPDSRLREILAETPMAQMVLSTPAMPANPDDPLTRRERDVVRLIARGKSNREIADALFIAEKTVETHVSNSLSKLGYHSRAQLAVWAARLA